MRIRQRCVLRPLLVPNIKFTALCVSAQTCWAELTLHSLHSSLLSSLLSIPPFFSAMIPRGNPVYRLWYNMGSYARYKLDQPHALLLSQCVYTLYGVLSYFLTTETEKYGPLKWTQFWYYFSFFQQKQTWSIGCMSVPLIATTEKHTHAHKQFLFFFFAYIQKIQYSPCF